MDVRNKMFKHKMLYCLILSFVLLFFGVFFEEVKVQSFFTYSSIEQKDAFVNDVGIKLVTSCSNETLGIRNSRVGNGVVRLIPGRRILRTLVLDIPLAEQVNSLSAFSSSVGVVQSHNERTMADVVLYIHKSDGKKRA